MRFNGASFSQWRTQLASESSEKDCHTVVDLDTRDTLDRSLIVIETPLMLRAAIGTPPMMPASSQMRSKCHDFVIENRSSRQPRYSPPQTGGWVRQCSSSPIAGGWCPRRLCPRYARYVSLVMFCSGRRCSLVEYGRPQQVHCGWLGGSQKEGTSHLGSFPHQLVVTATAPLGTWRATRREGSCLE